MEIGIEQAVEVLNALASEVRLAIVHMLVECDGLYCSDIVNRLNLSQPAISHHLKELRRSKVIVYRKEGSLVFYEVNREYLLKVLKYLSDLISCEEKVVA